MDFAFINDLIGSYQLNNELIAPIGGAIAITVAVVGIIYKVRSKGKKKSKYIILDENPTITNSNNQNSFNTEQVEQEYGELTIETIDFDSKNLAFNKKPRYSEEEKPKLFSASEQFIEEAIVFDTIQQKDEAISCIREALKHAEFPQERTRIQIILNKYISPEGHTLEELIKEFPPLHKFVIKNEFKDENKSAEPISFSLDDNILPFPPSFNAPTESVNKLSLEDKIASLANEAKQIEKEVEAANKNDNNNFWSAFGDMVGEIKSEVQEQHTQEIEINPITKQKLWVNWSKIENGQTVLHSDFYEIENTWGSQEAAEELQNFLNKEHSTQCAVLSVFPMLD